MCGRYVLKEPRQALRALVQAEFEEFSELRLFPRFNISPTQTVPIVILEESGRAAVEAKWAFSPPWAASAKVKVPLMINARAEGVAKSRAFRHAFSENRCLAPASGYYEWQTLAEKTKKPAKLPFYISPTSGALMAFAGLWEPLAQAEEERLRTFALMTTAAAPELEKIHNRMPVILAEADWSVWLKPGPLSEEDAERILAPRLSVPMGNWPVSSRVNSNRNEGPELIERVNPTAAETDPQMAFDFSF